MGAYILITTLLFWSAAAFTFGPTLVEDAVDAYAEVDPVYGNLALHMLWLTMACLISLPRICFDALTHYFTITLRR